MFIRKKKLKEIEKRIADLEVQVQSQQKNDFIPEDSSGKHYNSKSVRN